MSICEKCFNSISDKKFIKESYPSGTVYGNAAVLKFYPSKTELSVINNSIKCTEKECGKIFSSYSNLNLHLFKTHKKKDAIQIHAAIRQFHCPEISCIYHYSESFKNKKLLKQHYLKVHSPKNFVCGNCNEGFATEAFKNMHMDYCGVKFKCNDCPMSYPKYESLSTHARRKDHEINEKTFFKSKKYSTLNSSKSSAHLSNKIKSVFFKPIASVKPIPPSKLLKKKSDQSIQTEHYIPKQISKITQINQNLLLLNTRQTQTGFWKENSSIETQTIADSIKRIKKENIKEEGLITPQTCTQTKLVSLKSVSSNTLLSENDCVIPNSRVKKSTSSTQTLGKDSDVNCSTTTNTHNAIVLDTSDLIESNLESFNSQYFNCNMETQTDSIFNEDLFGNEDYYSNMYTQTCEDLLLNSLELNHIETQTMDDMLKSVEIQTTTSRNKPQTNSRVINHMETQTDLDLEEMLEAINA